MQSVIGAAFTSDGILAPYFRIESRGHHHSVFIQIGSKGDFYLRREQTGCEPFVNTFGNPSLAEIEIQIIEGNGLGNRLAQSRERFLRRGVVGILQKKRLDAVGFFDDVAGNEFVGSFVLVRLRIIINTAFQLLTYLFFGNIRKGCHIFQIDSAVFVQTGNEGFICVCDAFNLVGIECYGMQENIGFTGSAVDVSLQRKDFRSPRIHLYQVEITLVVEQSETFGELVVKLV